MPRRDAENFRRKEAIKPHLRNAIRPRDDVLADIRFFNNVRGHI
jgi:hypothetical protein